MRKILLPFVFTLFLSLACAAHTLNFKAGDKNLFTVELPVDWVITSDGPKLYLSPPGKLAWVGFWEVESKSVDEVNNAADVLTSLLFEDVEAEEPTTGELDGMPTRVFSGRASYEGEAAEFYLIYFSPEPGKVCLCFQVVGAEAGESVRDALETMIRSAKK